MNREAICLRKTEKAVGEEIYFRQTYALHITEWRMTGLMIQVQPGRRSEEEYDGWHVGRRIARMTCGRSVFEKVGVQKAKNVGVQPPPKTGSRRKMKLPRLPITCFSQVDDDDEPDDDRREKGQSHHCLSQTTSMVVSRVTGEIAGIARSSYRNSRTEKLIICSTGQLYT